MNSSLLQISLSNAASHIESGTDNLLAVCHRAPYFPDQLGICKVVFAGDYGSSGNSE